MQDDRQDQRGGSKWGLSASVAMHVVAVALLIFGLPQSLSSPQQETAVNVELVPPPKPLEKAKPAPPPAESPKVPAPKKADVKPPPASETVAAQASAMQPVVEFGEKDVGPRKSLEGNAAESGAEKPAAERVKAEPPTPKPTQSDAGEKQVSIAVVPQPSVKPNHDSAKPAKASPLAKAKTLFSKAVTDDPVAKTAIGKMPRDLRGATLCGTELRGQLVNAYPPYFPDLLPSVRLTSGAVVDVQAAFHAQGEWRTVSYRCEVDADVTKVVSFAFNVGALIPREDWQRLGLLPQ